MSTTNDLGASTTENSDNVEYTTVDDSGTATNRAFMSMSTDYIPRVPYSRHSFIDASRFWAVLIGIDAYPDGALNGCVSDALSMKQFLRECLHVPEGRIQCLLGSRDPKLSGGTLPPSRANIIQTLFNLITNDSIHKGDTIVIYFAGHGSSYECPKHGGQPDSDIPDSTADPDHTLCGIEAICPIDRSDESGIPDISDREFNSICTQISRTKGNNMTVVLDCCFASGAAREAPEGVRRAPQLRLRSVRKALETAHSRMQGLHGYTSVLNGGWVPDEESFVTLAACGECQTAKEVYKDDRYNGYFTRLLIFTLRHHWERHWTYGDLLDHVTRALNAYGNDQTPVLVGDFMDKQIWEESHRRNR